MRRAAAGAALAAAYAALAGLVAAGALARVDQWAASHLMPDVSKATSQPTFRDAVVPLVHANWSNAVDAVSSLATLPAQVVVSGLLVGAATLVPLLRGRGAAALVWPAAWLAGTAIEVLCKATLTRPALYQNGYHLGAFDASWPSGHTLRAIVVAAALAAAWPRLRAPVWAWAAVVPPLLVVGGAHTPSDVAGGVLLAALIVLAAGAAERSALLRGRLLRGGLRGRPGAASAPRRP